MLALAFVAWVVTGLICLADLLERRAEKRRNVVVELPKREPSNVTPIHRFENNVRTLPQRRWGA